MMKLTSFLLILFCLPLSLFVALIVFIESPAGVIFRQQRCGINRKEFIIYKFRTMIHGKVTLTGKILRKVGLDETPQLINILKGDMAFIGPRPLTAEDINKLGWNDARYDLRWHVLPGISGPAQLSNICSADVTMMEDLNYVKNRSFLLDLRILAQSFIVIFHGKRTD